MIEKTNLNPNEVGDIVVGTVLAPGSQRASECRMAAFYAGFPGTSAFNSLAGVVCLSYSLSSFIDHIRHLCDL